MKNKYAFFLAIATITIQAQANFIQKLDSAKSDNVYYLPADQYFISPLKEVFDKTETETEDVIEIETKVKIINSEYSEIDIALANGFNYIKGLFKK